MPNWLRNPLGRQESDLPRATSVLERDTEVGQVEAMVADTTALAASADAENQAEPPRINFG